MSFFDNLANIIVNFIRSAWGFMVSLAGAIVNNTFARFTGEPIDENIAAIMIYGGGVFIIGAVIFFKKSLVTK